MELLKIIAARSWKEFLANPDGSEQGDVDHNIHLAEALGCAALANFFKDDPAMDSGPIRTRLESYWSKIKATGDLDGDAATTLGWGSSTASSWRKRSAMKRTSALRVSAACSSDSAISSRRRACCRSSAMASSISNAMPSIFSTSANMRPRFSDDPTYLTVARRLYDPVTFANALTDKWGRATALLALDLSQRDPEPLPTASMVNYRATRDAPQPVVDKLILRTGTEPGSAMVMLDLYASGSHAHPFKGPQVAYYEVDGVPLFHNLGRHRTRSAITGNSFWAMEASRAFPACGSRASGSRCRSPWKCCRSPRTAHG